MATPTVPVSRRSWRAPVHRGRRLVRAPDAAAAAPGGIPRRREASEERSVSPSGHEALGPLEFLSEYQEAEAPVVSQDSSHTLERSMFRGHDFPELDVEEIFLSGSVASGGTAEVFRARWRGRQVAVKRFFKFRRVNVRRIVCVTRELSIMAKMRHPHVVEVIGACMAGPHYQLVTEYCEGGSLAAQLYGRSHVDAIFPQQVKMCIDIARAMEYFHAFEPQIIYRDLKSKNVFLAKELRSSKDIPVVKVTDFSASRMRDPHHEAESWACMTMGVGTTNWMAPEVLARSDYDQMVDVYSYAMVMFEILAGQIPFEELHDTQVIALVQSGARPDLRAVPPTCPPALLDLMTSCWEHGPKRRPAFSDIVSAVELVVRSSC